MVLAIQVEPKTEATTRGDVRSFEIGELIRIPGSQLDSKGRCRNAFPCPDQRVFRWILPSFIFSVGRPCARADISVQCHRTCTSLQASTREIRTRNRSILYA
jgi:hypothetical protein